jgi:hypothetical protein
MAKLCTVDTDMLATVLCTGIRSLEWKRRNGTERSDTMPKRGRDEPYGAGAHEETAEWSAKVSFIRFFHRELAEKV